MKAHLQVAVIHYHLNPGGVTRVIENSIHALQKSQSNIEIGIISSSSLPKTINVKSEKLPCLGYSDKEVDLPPEKLISELKKACFNLFQKLPDIWHFHNHSLGKKNSLGEIITQLAKEGCNMLLQTHDFGENGRTECYQRLLTSPKGTSELYPIRENIHYGLLNRRDLEILEGATPNPAYKKNIHIISNPVSKEKLEKSIPKREIMDVDSLILYPVRGIRRKNIGEIVLWSALTGDDTGFAISLSPENPKEKPQFNRWKQFSAKHNVPVAFGINDSKKFSFAQIINAADIIITTSIMEGFGMTFLEPWLYGKSLCGRDLPDITKDFKEKGIQLETLYSELPIPIDLINRKEFKNNLLRSLQKRSEVYRERFNRDHFEQEFDSLTQKGFIDFAILEETSQEKVILEVLHNPNTKKLIKEKVSLTPNQPKDIKANQEIVAREFDEVSSGKTLKSLYTQIAQSKPQNPLSFLDDKKILNAFLKLKNYSLLCN